MMPPRIHGLLFIMLFTSFSLIQCQFKFDIASLLTGNQPATSAQIKATTSAPKPVAKPVDPPAPSNPLNSLINGIFAKAAPPAAENVQTEIISEPEAQPTPSTLIPSASQLLAPFSNFIEISPAVVSTQENTGAQNPVQPVELAPSQIIKGVADAAKGVITTVSQQQKSVSLLNLFSTNNDKPISVPKQPATDVPVTPKKKTEEPTVPKKTIDNSTKKAVDDAAKKAADEVAKKAAEQAAAAKKAAEEAAKKLEDSKIKQFEDLISRTTDPAKKQMLQQMKKAYLKSMSSNLRSNKN